MNSTGASPISLEGSPSDRYAKRFRPCIADNAVRGLARWVLKAAFAVAVVLSLVLPATVLPTLDLPRIRLLATYLIPPTYVPVPALQFTGDRLVQIATPYITATYGVPPQPITQVDYPAALLDPTSIDQGVAALEADVAGDPKPVIFGYSQGASVLSVYKKAFNTQYADPAPGTAVPTPTYVVIGNPNRPNGGFSSRLSLLGLPPIGGTAADSIPTPTETAGAAPGQITTYDFVHQYDFFADFPNRPLNVFSLVNAAFGAILSHATYGDVRPSDAVLQDKVGDTAYYMIPVPLLPLLQPLAALGVPSPILAALDAPLRVLVEAGYDRTISPGTPTAAQLLPVANPIRTVINFAISIPTGLDDASQLLGQGRPFGTMPAGPYGVGGPPVTLSGTAAPTSTALTSFVKPAAVSREIVTSASSIAGEPASPVGPSPQSTAAATAVSAGPTHVSAVTRRAPAAEPDGTTSGAIAISALPSVTASTAPASSGTSIHAPTSTVGTASPEPTVNRNSSTSSAIHGRESVGNEPSDTGTPGARSTTSSNDTGASKTDHVNTHDNGGSPSA